MGPSGSGKSTMMHILAGLDEPTEGTVVIDGVEITTLKERDADPVAARQDRLHLPVVQPAADADRRGEPRAAADDRRPQARRRAGSRASIDKVGLADRRTHRPAELSGGQQQKVAIARALVGQPAVVFRRRADRQPRLEVGRRGPGLLRGSADDLGQTIVMVTHDARAAAIADRIVFLQDGRIVLDCGHMSRDQIYDTIKDLEATAEGNGGAEA